MSSGAQVAKNAAWLIAATTAQKGVSFLSFSIVARVVGPETMGIFFFAISITSIFVTFTDLGLTPVLIREMASDEKSGRAFLGKALHLKFVLIPTAVLGVLLYGWVTGLSGMTYLAVALACFVMSTDALSLLWYGVIRGRRLLRFEAMGMFVGQILTATISISAAFLGWGVIGLVCALMLGSFWNVGWSFVQGKKLGLTPLLGGNWTMARISKSALPFALAGIFVKIYSYFDTLLLKQYHSIETVGHYAVAYKVTYALQFLPLAFIAALYPGMSAAASAKKTHELKALLKGSLRLMMFVSVPLTALLSGLAEPIVQIVYGARYSGSIIPLSILPLVLIPIFLDFPIGSLLNATHRASFKTTAMGIAMVVNVTANILLVPPYGAMGAAWAGVISFSILPLIGFWFIRKDLQGEWMWMSTLLVRGLLAAALIWFSIRFALSSAPWGYTLVAPPFYALLVLYLLRLFQKEDFQRVVGWLQRKAVMPDKTEEDFHEKP